MDRQATPLDLPDGIEVLDPLGGGRYGQVYKARFQGEDVALKTYTQRAIDWYRKKLNVNIAVHEMARNREFRKVPALVPYTAKPLRVIGQDGKGTLCFLQEFIDGLTLEQLAEKVGHLPHSLLSAGKLIDRSCEEAGLEGVDTIMREVLVRQQSGQWVPVMYDFKHPPQARPARGGGGSLLARLGLGRGKTARSGFLQDWERLAQRLEKPGG